MALSERAREIASEITGAGVKLGDLKKLAKEIKQDHDLAQELWSTGEFHPRLLATLLFDKKSLSEESLEEFAAELGEHEEKQRNQLSDWLLANQLMKDKRLIGLLESWRQHSSPMLRRWFWYHQARLRWTGQAPPENTGELLDSLEKDLAAAEPEVQWAMNFCAGWIGVHDPDYRARCIELGEATGLYRDEPVARNCTPNYLPEFIRIEVAKRQ